MNADIIADKDKYNDWDNPYYMAGYQSGCEATRETKPLRQRKLEEERDDLIKENANLIGMQKELIAVRDEHIKELYADLELRGHELEYLKQPWYVKLWKKIPRIKISIVTKEEENR